MRDIYKVLGVTSKADDARVKSAFRDRAKTLHPDVNAGDATAEQRFKELNQAYETLSDPKARAAYELGMADERIRSRRHMRSVTITMFVISMFSTVSIFGALIWLLAVAHRTALADVKRPSREVVGSLRERQEKAPHAGDLGSRAKETEPKQAAQPPAAVASNIAPAEESPPPPASRKDAAPAPAISPALLSPCGAQIVEEELGLLSMTLVDRSRAGGSIIVKADELDYRATFAADGRLRLVAPTLSANAVFQWALAGSTPCRQSSTAALFPRLSIALVWAGYASLEMHVMEPNAWLGSPFGHISSSRPNLAGTYGAGKLRVFGQPGDSTRVQLFVVDPAKLGDRKFLNAVVTFDGTGDCARAGQTSEVRYQVHIFQSGRERDVPNSEVRSMAFQLPRCGEPAGERVRSENILVRL